MRNRFEGEAAGARAEAADRRYDDRHREGDKGEDRGDTLFASMYAAYDALSDRLKATLERLRALHSSRHVFGPTAATRRGDLEGRIRNAELATQDAVHPVVIRHPDTGRKALYVNPGFTLPPG